MACKAAYIFHTYAEKGQDAKAISDLTKAIVINPKFADAYNSRGVIYFFIKEYEKSWGDVHKAESLGYKADSGFLEALREASGREE